jgi:hypothetical protein
LLAPLEKCDNRTRTASGDHGGAMTYEKPKFRKEFDTENQSTYGLRIDVQDSDKVMYELHRCYKVIDAAVEIIALAHYLNTCADVHCIHIECARRRKFMELIK